MPLNRLPSNVRMLQEKAPRQPRQRMRGGNWMSLRERVLMRAKGLCECQECQANGFARPAEEVDHRIPLHQGGTDDLDNLQAISKACHAKKTAAELLTRLHAVP